MSGVECNFCATAISAVDELHRSGGHTEGGSFTFQNVTGSGPLGDGAHYIVDLDLIEAVGVRVSAGGAEESFGGELFPAMAISVAREANEWKIDGVDTGIEEP